MGGNVLVLFYLCFFFLFVFLPIQAIVALRDRFSQAFSPGILRWVCGLHKPSHLLHPGDVDVVQLDAVLFHYLKTTSSDQTFSSSHVSRLTRQRWGYPSGSPACGLLCRADVSSSSSGHASCGVGRLHGSAQVHAVDGPLRVR